MWKSKVDLIPDTTGEDLAAMLNGKQRYSNLLAIVVFETKERICLGHGGYVKQKHIEDQADDE